MTNVFDEDGIVYPVTVVNAGPLVVTQVKTLETDGYDSVQFGYGERKESNISKAVKGHTKDLGNFEALKENRVNETDLKVGDKVDVSAFEEGDKVTISSISKGKGFQGVVKRWNFAGGRRSHGNKHHERTPGSIGATGPQRVLKGLKMAGRMGSDRITVKNLKIVKVDKDTNQLYIKGAVPGKRGTLVEIRG